MPAINESDNNQPDKDFLISVYEQSNAIGIAFANIRFLVLSMFAVNATLFHYVHEKQDRIPVILTSIIAIIFAWMFYFIDRKNRQIIRRAIGIKRAIENHFKIPDSMQYHKYKGKKSSDAKIHEENPPEAISYKHIFISLSMLSTAFWLLYAFNVLWWKLK